jgi:nucleoside-diphosphate-sugar epimerase
VKILKFKNGNDTHTEKILITGALGQIGTELTNRLVEIHGAENVIASGLDRWTRS